MTIDGVKQYKIIEELLRSGKRIATEDRVLTYYEDFNNPNATSWGSDKTKRTEIIYIYTNPQFNRMFAHLVDGRNVDYDLSFMSIFWNSFVEYIPPEPSKKKMTIEEIKQELGYNIEII